MFNKLIAGWGIFLAFLFFLPLKAQKPVTDSAIIAIINGEKAETGEWQWFIREYRATTIRHFLSISQSNYSKDFWNTQIQGTTPMESLKRQAFDSLVRMKIQQMMARERGIIHDISYSGFLKKLESENRRREQAVQNHHVIYGPVQYSERVFYPYLYGNVIMELKKDSSLVRQFGNENPDIRSDFARKKNEFCSLGFRSVVQLIGQDGRLDMRHFFLNDTIHLPEDSQSVESQLRPVISDLSAGDTSRFFEYEGKTWRAILREKIQLGFRSDETCFNLIRLHLFDEWYDSRIDSLVRNARIQINRDTWDTITF